MRQHEEKVRPKPAALMRRMVGDIFIPLVSDGVPNLADYEVTNIAQVWEYGPIGYQGECWCHKTLAFYIAKLENQDPWVGLIPNFGVAQLKRMVVASHKIDGLRCRGGGGRRVSGSARGYFEFRISDACVVAVLEDSYERNALIMRCYPMALAPEEPCVWAFFDALYPEKN